MTGRCEPPEHLRGVDGWHWVQWPEGPPQVLQWRYIMKIGEYGWALRDYATTATGATKAGWRYIAPVSTPSEVAALRAERDDWRRKAGEGWQAASDEAQKADAIRDRLEALQDVLDEGDAENATLRARVATLAALVHDVLSTRAADHAEAHSIGWVYRARAALDGVEHNGMPGR